MMLIWYNLTIIKNQVSYQAKVFITIRRIILTQSKQSQLLF